MTGFPTDGPDALISHYREEAMRNAEKAAKHDAVCEERDALDLLRCKAIEAIEDGNITLAMDILKSPSAESVRWAKEARSRARSGACVDIARKVREQAYKESNRLSGPNQAFLNLSNLIEAQQL